MNHVKGIFATVSVPVSIGVAWLPAVETGLRIGVSLAGIFAGIYAARYWHKRTQLLGRGKDDE